MMQGHSLMDGGRGHGTNDWCYRRAVRGGGGTVNVNNVNKASHWNHSLFKRRTSQSSFK